MTVCVAPPELDELQLSMYLDGEAAPWVAEHLARCPHCRDNVQGLARAQNSLRRQLYRIHCPTSDELRDYHFGLLARAETTSVEGHLQFCPHCAHHLAMLNEFVAEDEFWMETEPEPVESPLQRIRQLVAGLLPIGAIGLAPAFGGTRGESTENQAVYQAGEVRIYISVQGDADMPDRRELLGSILGEVAGGWTVHLWREQERLLAIPIDDLGSFRFSHLLPAHYTLTIMGPQMSIYVPVVAVS